ncbi:hypothetical protein [Pedobacter nyackensis]|uniref:hypothetical protein n=1 Tax=Pedobacter nyackensis TaxID=475255 RepID=UPI00292E8CDB|nr:hypothetical protein [Pedobacter nyackensis]
MALITYIDKSQEDNYDPNLWNADDANEIKNVINTNAAALDLKADITALDLKADVSALAGKANVSALATKADLVAGIIPLNQLPNAILSTNQFELLEDGSIGIKTSYLMSLGLTGTGGTVTPTLSTPSLTATAASTTQINLSWGAITNATSYMLQRASVSNYSDASTIYTGSAISYNNSELTASTTYYYRVKATANGYNDSNYAGTSATTNTAGATTPSAPTAFIVDDVNNTADWTNNPTYTSVNDYEYTLDGGVTVNNVTVKPVNVGDIAKSAGQVGVRIKAASGRNVSAWLFNATAYTSTGGGTYLVEKTFRINLASQYGNLPANSAPYYNSFNPTQSVIQSPSGFTSTSFIDDTNAASSIVFQQKGAFAGQTAEISGAQASGGNTGVFPNNVVNTAWTINGGTNASIGLSGLDPTKFYQIYVLMPSDTTGTTRGATINGVTKNKTSSTTVLATFGVAGNGLNDPEFIVFNNITGSAVDIAFNRVSGNYGALVSLVVVEQTNIAK